jgi:hypothetical protein
MALTGVDDLVTRIEHDPDNIVLAAMLVDELVEARGMYRWEAMLHVQRVQTTAHDQLDMEWLAKLITRKGPAFRELVTTIQSALALYPGETITLFVVTGSNPPRIGEVPTDVPEGAIFHGFPVAVPATWARTWWHSSGRPAIMPISRPAPARRQRR